VRAHAIALLPRHNPASTFDACSICLRVREDSRWIDAAAAIRLSRSFENDMAPRLRPGVCDECAAAISLRRGRRPALKAA
jgi:hypothetical protein